MTERAFTFEQLHITTEEVCRQMGYVDGMADQRLRAEIDGEMSRVAKVAVPRMCYVVRKATLSNTKLVADGVALNIGSTIARQLSGSEAFAFFVATAGVEFDAYLHSLSAGGDMVRSFVADAIGSLIAEHTADAMERILEASIGKLGWQHTNRFSPGYCSWHVEGQHGLFSLLGSRPCGVILNESAMMIPLKSVSGIIGLGADVRHLDYPCVLCGMKNCHLRRTTAD